MAVENKHETDPRESEQVRVPARVWIIWIAVLGGIILLVLFKENAAPRGERISQYQFEELVDAGRIARATIYYDPQNSALNEVAGQYYRTENNTPTAVPFQAKIRLTRSLEEKLLHMAQIEARQPNTVLMNVVWSLLPFVVIAMLIWFFFIRQIRNVVRVSPNSADPNARTLEQQDRLDRILDKWEGQAARVDAVLDKIEKNK
jgi:ATP-dependent Zn protease